MINADQYLNGLDEKPIIYFVYAYYDKDIKRFNVPIIVKDEPGMMVDGIKGAINKGRVKREDLAGQVLYFLGTYDLKTGVFDLLPIDKYEVLVDCEQVFSAGGEIDG